MEERRKKPIANARITSLPTVDGWNLIKHDFKRRCMKYASEISTQGTKEKAFMHQLLAIDQGWARGCKLSNPPWMPALVSRVSFHHRTRPMAAAELRDESE